MPLREGSRLNNVAYEDDLLERGTRAIAFHAASLRDVQSLRNWHLGNACISREEMDFLSHEEDLLCLSSTSDDLWL